LPVSSQFPGGGMSDECGGLLIRFKRFPFPVEDTYADLLPFGDLLKLMKAGLMFFDDFSTIQLFRRSLRKRNTGE